MRAFGRAAGSSHRRVVVFEVIDYPNIRRSVAQKFQECAVFRWPEFTRERQCLAGSLNFHVAAQSSFGNSLFDAAFVFRCLGLRTCSSRLILRLRTSLGPRGAGRRAVGTGF